MNIEKELFSFSENLKILMDDKSMRAVDLSKATNIPDNFISCYMLGHYLPEIENGIKIAKVLKCSLNYLYGYTDDSEVKKTSELKFVDIYLSLLDENKINNIAFCKQNNLDPKAIYRWKLGKLPAIRNLLKIKEGFGVSLDYLVGDLHWKNK